MTIALQIPTALRDYCGGVSDFSLSASTVRAALEQLERDQPSLYRSICDETGAVRRHLNVFVNSNLVPIRTPGGLDVPLQPGDVLTVWTAVSGG